MRPSALAVRYRQASRLMQVAIGVVLLSGLATRNLAVVVNGAVALAVTFVPALLERDYRITLGPALTAFITGALLLHTLGMLGIYGTVWWWDHVTHTLSAGLVAGAGYATVRAFDEHSDAVHFPPQFLFVFILLMTLAFGVLWELLEFLARELAELTGAGPVLVIYGLEDTVVDLVFDLVGALLVGLFGTQAVEDVVDQLTERFDTWAARRQRR